MNKLAALGTVVAGIVTASCSHGSSGALPPTGARGLGASSGAVGTMGARTVRPKSAGRRPGGLGEHGHGPDRPGERIRPRPARPREDGQRGPVGFRCATSTRPSRRSPPARRCRGRVRQPVRAVGRAGVRGSVVPPGAGLRERLARAEQHARHGERSAAAVEKAFNTSLHGFSVDGKSVFREHAARVRSGRARRQRRRGARADELSRAQGASVDSAGVRARPAVFDGDGEAADRVHAERQPDDRARRSARASTIPRRSTSRTTSPARRPRRTRRSRSSPRRRQHRDQRLALQRDELRHAVRPAST